MGYGSGKGGWPASFVSRVLQRGQLPLLLFAYLGCSLFGSGTVPYDVLVCQRACGIQALFQGSEHHWQAKGDPGWQQSFMAGWHLLRAVPSHGGIPPLQGQHVLLRRKPSEWFLKLSWHCNTKGKGNEKTHFFQTNLNLEYIKPKKKKVQVRKKPSATHATVSYTGVVITTWVGC